MYAIVESGGVQFKVQEGDVIDVPKLAKASGETVTLDKVLLVADGDKISVGTPLVGKAVVNAEVVGAGRTKKIAVFKYKPKKSYALMKGHRQDYTKIKITAISL